jgi:very-short-patch-repair endonuclease
VYAVGHLAPVEFGDEVAALLAIHARAFLSYLTAARIWKLLPRPTQPPIELTVIGQAARKRPGIRVHRTRRLHPQETRIRHGLPVTSPARTLLDIAGSVSPRELERALDEALIRNLVRLNQISEVVERAATERGRGVLKALVEDRTHSTLTRSEAEESFLALIRKADLPAPEVNVHLHGYQVDFFWRERRLVVEIDGYQFHSSHSAFERDRRKDRRLKGGGIGVLRFSATQVTREPLATVAAVAHALR